MQLFFYPVLWLQSVRLEADVRVEALEGRLKEVEEDTTQLDSLSQIAHQFTQLQVTTSAYLVIKLCIFFILKLLLVSINPIFETGMAQKFILQKLPLISINRQS